MGATHEGVTPMNLGRTGIWSADVDTVGGL
jgi:hypothetical protein